MSERPPARFISLEGGEGTGKSTHARRLSETLTERGIENIITREPGGSEGAEHIRKLLVEGEPGRWEPVVEVMLFAAARADHVARTVCPALAAGKWVICDRFSDSTYAYQGAGRGLDSDTVDRIERIAIGDFKPNLTLVLDVPVSEALNRIAARSHAENRFERFDTQFHERLRQFYRDLASREPERCVLIDASAPVDRVAESIWCAVATRFNL